MNEVASFSPNNWRKVPLSEVADIVRGVSYPKSDAREGAAPGFIPILRATNIQSSNLALDRDLVFVAERNLSEHQLLQVGDIVIATSSGSKDLVGKSGQLRSAWHGSFGAFCATVRPRPGIKPTYLALFFQTPAYWQQIRSRAVGVNINNLRRSDLETLVLPVPPPSVQLSLVAEIEKQFSRLDEAVASLERAKANLARYKAAILKAAVEGRLVPTEASLSRLSGHPFESGAALLSRITAARRMTWAGRGRYSEPIPVALNAPLPSGWAWSSVDQLLSSLRNGLSRKPTDAPPGVPILRISSVRPMAVDLNDHRYYRKEPDESVDGQMLRNGDLLFVRYNGTKELVGACAVVPQVPGFLIYPDKLIRGRVVSRELVLPDFIALASNVGRSRQHIDELIKTTAGQQGIAGGEIKRMPIPLPPLAEQRRIVAEVDRLMSIARATEAQLDTALARAARLRQSILSRAFSGSSEATG